MASELKEALRTASEPELAVTGRRSGRDISNPVWFVQEDETLYLLPVAGADSDWYRNVRKTATIRLGASGIEVRADAMGSLTLKRCMRSSPKFRAKYGSNADRLLPEARRRHRAPGSRASMRRNRVGAAVVVRVVYCWRCARRPTPGRGCQRMHLHDLQPAELEVSRRHAAHAAEPCRLISASREALCARQPGSSTVARRCGP
jgi:hypothetical protein